MIELEDLEKAADLAAAKRQELEKELRRLRPEQDLAGKEHYAGAGQGEDTNPS